MPGKYCGFLAMMDDGPPDDPLPPLEISVRGPPGDPTHLTPARCIHTENLSVDASGVSSLTSLPPEIAEEILLHLLPSDIYSVCSASPGLLSICLDPRFWRARFSRKGILFPVFPPPLFSLTGWTDLFWFEVFRKEGLPLIEYPSHTPTEWESVYERSKQAREEAENIHRELRDGKGVYTLDINDLPDPEMIRTGNVNMEEYSRLVRMRKKLIHLQREEDKAREGNFTRSKAERVRGIRKEMKILPVDLALLIEVGDEGSTYEIIGISESGDYTEFHIYEITPEETKFLFYKTLYYRLRWK